MIVKWCISCDVAVFDKFMSLKKSTSYEDDGDFLDLLLEFYSSAKSDLKKKSKKNDTESGIRANFENLDKDYSPPRSALNKNDSTQNLTTRNTRNRKSSNSNQTTGDTSPAQHTKYDRHSMQPVLASTTGSRSSYAVTITPIPSVPSKDMSCSYRTIDDSGSSQKTTTEATIDIEELSPVFPVIDLDDDSEPEDVSSLTLRNLVECTEDHLSRFDQTIATGQPPAISLSTNIDALRGSGKKRSMVGDGGNQIRSKKRSTLTNPAPKLILSRVPDSDKLSDLTTPSGEGSIQLASKPVTMCPSCHLVFSSSSSMTDHFKKDHFLTNKVLCNMTSGCSKCHNLKSYPGLTHQDFVVWFLENHHIPVLQCTVCTRSFHNVHFLSHPCNIHVNEEMPNYRCILNDANTVAYCCTGCNFIANQCIGIISHIAHCKGINPSAISQIYQVSHSNETANVGANLPSVAFMCHVCAAIYSSRCELNNHYKLAHMNCSDVNGYLCLCVCSMCKCFVFSSHFDEHSLICDKLVFGSFHCTVGKAYVCERCSTIFNTVTAIGTHVLQCSDNSLAQLELDLDIELSGEIDSKVVCKTSDDFADVHDIIDIKPDDLKTAEGEGFANTMETPSHSIITENQAVEGADSNDGPKFRLCYGCPLCQTATTMLEDQRFIGHLVTHESRFFKNKSCVFCSVELLKKRAEHIANNHVPYVWVCETCKFSVASLEPPVHDCESEIRPVIGEKFIAFVPKTGDKTLFSCQKCSYKTDIYDDEIKEVNASTGIITHLGLHSRGVAPNESHTDTVTCDAVVDKAREATYCSLVELWHCPLCSHTSNARIEILSHLKLHTIVMENSWCDYCSKFCTHSTMYDHMVLQHVQSMYHCLHCSWLSKNDYVHTCAANPGNTVRGHAIFYKLNEFQHVFQCNYCLYFSKFVQNTKSGLLAYDDVIDHLNSLHSAVRFRTPNDELKVHNVACVLCKKILMDRKEFDFHMSNHNRLAEQLRLEQALPEAQQSTSSSVPSLKQSKKQTNKPAGVQNKSQMGQHATEVVVWKKRGRPPKIRPEVSVKVIPTIELPQTNIELRDKGEMALQNVSPTATADNATLISKYSLRWICAWQCPLCPKRQADTFQLMDHITTTHQSHLIDKYCLFCARKINNELSNHMVMCHSVRTVCCEVCSHLSLHPMGHLCKHKALYDLRNFYIFSTGEKCYIRCISCLYVQLGRLLNECNNEIFQRAMESMQSHWDQYHSEHDIPRLLNDIMVIVCEDEPSNQCISNQVCSPAQRAFTSDSRAVHTSGQDPTDDDSILDHQDSVSGEVNLENIYCCPLCLKLSTTITMVTEHLRSFHSIDTMTNDGKCSVCGQKTNEDIFIHILKHIPKVWLCRKCDWFAAVRHQPIHECDNEYRPRVGDGFYVYRADDVFFKYRCWSCAFETNSFEMKNGKQITMIQHLTSHVC